MKRKTKLLKPAPIPRYVGPGKGRNLMEIILNAIFPER